MLLLIGLMEASTQIILAFGVVSSCKSILENLCDFSVLHVYRECNRLADLLANLSHTYNLGFHILDKGPSGASQILEADYKGVMYPREVRL